MPKAITRQAYAARIERVAAAVQNDLDRPWRLEDLAGIAALSPYHFHRVYRAMAGETLADTLRRHRLHRAACDLIEGAPDLMRVARRAGYGSTAAFTRAFAQAHGLPPNAYRATRRAPSPPGLVLTLKEPPMSVETLPNVVVETTPALRLVGLAHQGDYQAIGATFEKLALWAAAHGLPPETTRTFGIYYDDPSVTPVRERRAFAGMLVEGDVPLTGGVEFREIPAGLIATIVHKGPYAELEGAYRALYEDWLPTSGRAPAQTPCFEEYLNDPKALPPSEWLTKVAMPLAA